MIVNRRTLCYYKGVLRVVIAPFPCHALSVSDFNMYSGTELRFCFWSQHKENYDVKTQYICGCALGVHAN